MCHLIFFCLLEFQYSTILTTGLFEEKLMLKHVEACEWLSGALHSLEVSNIDPCYANMRAVCPFHLLWGKV
jgi:hypothetical protein